MPIKLKNNASSFITANITSSQTSITLVSGGSFPTLLSGEYFYRTLEDTNGNVEIVKVTARSGNNLTVVRGQDGSTPRGFPTSSRFELRVNVASIEGGPYTPAGANAVSRTIQEKLQDVISVKDFGAVGDGVADDTTAIQNALDAAQGKTLYLGADTYKCTSGVQVKGDVEGAGATLMFYGSTAGGTFNSCVYQAQEGSLRNFIIDASNVTSCQAGLYVDTDFVQTSTCYYDLVIKNISNSDNTQAAYAALFFKSSGASVNLNSDLDIKIHAENIVATANGVIGDAGGSAQAVVVSFNGTGTNSRVNIHDCYVENVNCGPVDPDEDADGIRVFVGDFQVDGAKGSYVVQNCHTIDALKRGFKIQAQNCVVSNCSTEGVQQEAFGIYGINDVVQNCRSIDNNATCYAVYNKGSKIINCYGISEGFAVLRVYPSATQTIIDNCEFVYDAEVTIDPDLRAVVFLDNGHTQMSNCILENTQGDGTGIKFQSGTFDTSIDNTRIKNVEYGMSFVTGVGDVYIDHCVIDASVQGMQRSGSDSALDVYVSNSEINSDGPGIVFASSNRQGLLFLSNTRVISGGFGVACNGGSSIISNEIASDSTTEDGIIVAGKSDIMINGNIIRGFRYALDYQNTTNIAVMNNISIDADLGLAIKAGYTPFVEENNFAR